MFETYVATSLPTLTQSVSLPPKMLMCLVVLLTSISCFRDICIQSRSLVLSLPAFTTSGRTPQRSAMMSVCVSGFARLSRLLMLSRTNWRSSSVTSLNGDSVRVSVVPTQVRAPKYDEVARVGAEKRTYSPESDPKGKAFLADVVRGTVEGFNDFEARERIARHMTEERVERGEQLTRAAGSAAFAGLVVPQYLTDLYAPAA